MPIDRQRLKLTATTPEEEQEVLALFFRLAEEKLNTMKNARRSNERTHWKSAAHYLKGSAANIGLIPLSEACRTAELHTDADYQQHTAMLQAIEHEFERAREFAKTM